MDFLYLSFLFICLLCHGVHILLLYCIVVGFRRLMPPDALQLKACCTNPGL